jgi:peptidoglycan hydrolase CwlO-like protein
MIEIGTKGKRDKKLLFSKEVFCLLGAALVIPILVFGQSTGEKKLSIQEQIDALEREASVIDGQIQATQKETKTFANEVSIFNNEIRRKEIEVKKINLAIRQAGSEIKDKSEGIRVIEGKVAASRRTLAASLVALSQKEDEGMFEVLLKNSRLSNFFTAIDNLLSIQSRVTSLLTILRGDREELQKEQEELRDFQKGQQSLRALQISEQRALNQKKKEKDELLRLTKGKEALFQKLLSAKKKDIAALKTELFYLEKTGITAEDALRYATLAAERAGIRPAFLLALLEVETGRQFEDGIISVGTNVGTGNWKTDMYDCRIRLKARSAAESQKNAFFAITDKLGLDPDQMPVSRRASYGCGGAMGPAQFIPTTWLLFEERVAELTGHNPPNPWNVEDAFTASAIFLADGGATSKTTAGEMRAARIYISGRSTCSTRTASGRACNWYANRVASLTREIDRAI